MSIQRALLLDVYLSSSTRNDKRSEDERHLYYDIPSFNQREFTLDANNEDGNNPDSSLAIGAISTFVYFYAPYPVELTMGPLHIPGFKKLLILPAPLSGFSVQNIDKTRSVTCSIVFA